MDVEQLQNLDLFAEFTDLCIPLFIFKCQSSGEKIGPAIKATADRLRCYAELTETGWMNDKVFTWYIAEIVNSWLVGKRFGKPLDHLKVHLQPGDTKALVMDVHASHKTDEVLESLKLMSVKPVYVDPGLTCKCQVMDVAGNKGFKHSVGKRHREWRRENPTTRVDRNMVMEWGCLAHYDVPSEGIKKAVEKHILVLQKSAEGVEPANDGHSAEEIAKYTAPNTRGTICSYIFS